MKKKLAVILMSSILAVSSLVGCGNTPASESGTENANTSAAEANTSSDAKTITVWAWDDNFNVAVMKEAAEVYKKTKYSLQGTTQGRYLTGGVPPVRFSM